MLDPFGTPAITILASSSRSQIDGSSSRPYLWVVLLRLSMVVRGSPCKDVAIVTQLGTQAAHRCPVAVDSRRGLAGLPAGLYVLVIPVFAALGPGGYLAWMFLLAFKEIR